MNVRICQGSLAFFSSIVGISDSFFETLQIAGNRRTLSKSVLQIGEERKEQVTCIQYCIDNMFNKCSIFIHFLHHTRTK